MDDKCKACGAWFSSSCQSDLCPGCKRALKRLNGYAVPVVHGRWETANDGGDYIKLLEWLEETGRNIPIKIHSMNPVGVANMRAIIRRNDWREIL